MPNRYTGDSKYKYGFQGQEQDNEIKGQGNSYSFGARMLDPRIGRWFSTDNVMKSYLSQYQFASNSPIIMIDPDGNDEFYFNADGSWKVITSEGSHRFFNVTDEGFEELNVHASQFSTGQWVGFYFASMFGATDAQELAGKVRADPSIGKYLQSRQTNSDNKSIQKFIGIYNTVYGPMTAVETVIDLMGAAALIKSVAKVGTKYIIKYSAKGVLKEAIVNSSGKIISGGKKYTVDFFKKYILGSEKYVSPSSEGLLKIMIEQSSKPFRTFGKLLIRGTGGLKGNTAIYDIAHVEGGSILKALTGLYDEALNAGAKIIKVRSHAVVNSKLAPLLDDAASSGNSVLGGWNVSKTGEGVDAVYELTKTIK